MKTVVKAVWYIDDDNVKHITVIHQASELQFLKSRFIFVGTFEDFI
jgi:hypothetical protein